MTWNVECRVDGHLCGWLSWHGPANGMLCDPREERAYEFEAKPDAEVSAEKFEAWAVENNRNITCHAVEMKS